MKITETRIACILNKYIFSSDSEAIVFGIRKAAKAVVRAIRAEKAGRKA